MIEQQLVRGIRLRWQIPQADTSGPKDGSIINNPARASVLRYDGVDGKIVDLASAPNVHRMGLQVGQAIPHDWLTYSHGHTPRIARNSDILTGPMSGCWITRWTDAGGQKWVGHLGTVESSVAVSTAAKAGFRAAMNQFAKVRGFNPANAWDPGEILPLMAKLRGDPNKPPSVSIVALVTRTGHFYSLLMFRLGYGDEWVVGGSKRVHGTNQADLAQRLA